METPLWYQIRNHQLGFDGFLDRFQSSHPFTEKEILAIFILSCIYQHNPYLSSGHHVLFNLITNRIVTESALRCFYTYWAFGNDRINENIIESNPISGTFVNYSVELPTEFDIDYLENWLYIMIGAFLPIGLVSIKPKKYYPGDLDKLVESTGYYERLNEQHFHLNNITVDKLTRLNQAHGQLANCREFFLGQKFPRFLKPYRDDPIVFQELVNLYWPDVLKSFEIERPFNSDELDLLNEAHKNLYESGDINFLFDYVNRFSQLFENLPITQELLRMITPSSENDQLRAKQYLMKLTPDQRTLVLPFDIPVSDDGVKIILDRIGKNGVEQILSEILEDRKKRILNQLSIIGGKINNTEILESGESVFDYPMNQLILYTDDQNYYAFTRHEIYELAEKKENPFNREPIPDYLFSFGTETHSQTYYDIWESILKRKLSRPDED